MPPLAPLHPLHPLLRRLGMRLPIIQAPMAGTSTPQMAAAVTNAGALGSLGIGAMSPSVALSSIREAQALTSGGAVNINVFVHIAPTSSQATSAAYLEALRPVFARFGAAPPGDLKAIYKGFNDDPEFLSSLEEAQPRVVSFHFGLPKAESVTRMKEWGAVLLASVTNLDEAMLAQQAGMDGVIAQGYEAGGHRGVFDPFGADEQMGTRELVRVLVASKEMKLPIIAAGGIMDGQGVMEVLEMGAVAAQMGTVFVNTKESAADEHHRAAIERVRQETQAGKVSGSGVHAGNKDESTVMTTLISGRPARIILNDFTALAQTALAEVISSADGVPHYPFTYDVGKALNAAAKAAGEGGYGAHWAGVGVGRAREDNLGCAQVIRALEEEMGLGGERVQAA